MFIVDTATNMVTGSIEVGDRPWGMALSPDGKRLVFAAVDSHSSHRALWLRELDAVEAKRIDGTD